MNRKHWAVLKLIPLALLGMSGCNDASGGAGGPDGSTPPANDGSPEAPAADAGAATVPVDPTRPLDPAAFCEGSAHGAASEKGAKVFERWSLRAERWATGSIEHDDIRAAFSSIEEEDPFRADKGSWLYELRAVGCEHDAKGVALDRAGDTAGALDAYRTARQFYDIARFPFLATPEREAVYLRMNQLYQRIGVLNDTPVKEIAIPVQGKEVKGYLRLPKNVANPALVVFTGGLDTWKTSFDAYLLPMHEAGLATFSFDMPGVGSSEFLLTPDGSSVYSAVAEYFSTYPGIDGAKIGLYTASFSGAIGLELALLDPRFKAVVDNGGGAHHLYVDKPKFVVIPGMENIPMVDSLVADLKIMQQAILWTLGFRKNTTDGWFEAMNVWVDKLPPLSLEKQGVLKPSPNQAPLLHIHGGKDDLIPIKDFEIVGQKGIQEDVLFYPEDDHCAPQNFADHHPKAIAWLKDKLR